MIDVHDLNSDDRRQILYNHLTLGNQPREFRTAVKPHLEMVASHERFIPETARRLSDSFFTKTLSLEGWAIADFVQRREQFLVDVCSGLDADSRAALALVYMRNGRLTSPISPTADEAQALARMNSTLGASTEALQALKGSLVAFTVVDGEPCWTFRHPTIGDAYATILRTNPELLGIYIRGSHVDKLMEQVTCGDTQVQGAVIVPRTLFRLMASRLVDYKSSTSYKHEWLAIWGAERSLLRFLARRCTKEFLELFLPMVPHVVQSISKPGLHLDHSPEVDLVLRLAEFELLSEEVRSSFAQTVSTYALNGSDGRALSDPHVRAVLTGD